MITIIMNCYNGGLFLRETLDSVYKQSYTNWEIVFWDNCSTDDSAAIFQSYKDPRFKYFLADTHTSLGEARNLAVSKARGEWIAFIDHDDVWYPNKLEQQMQAIEENPLVGIVYGPVDLIVNSTKSPASSLHSTLTRRVSRPHAAKNIYNDLLNGNFIIFSTVLLRTDALLDIKGFDCRLKQNEDYDILLKVAYDYQAVCIEEKCAAYRIHANNSSHLQEELSYLENELIFNKLPQSKCIEQARCRNASRYAVFFIKNYRFFEGFSLILKKGSFVWVFSQLFTRMYFAVKK